MKVSWREGVLAECRHPQPPVCRISAPGPTSLKAFRPQILLRVCVQCPEPPVPPPPHTIVSNSNASLSPSPCPHASPPAGPAICAGDKQPHVHHPGRRIGTWGPWQRLHSTDRVAPQPQEKSTPHRIGVRDDDRRQCPGCDAACGSLPVHSTRRGPRNIGTPSALTNQ